ncbi:MAG TPA: hypothetical protein VMF90_21560 [Rhizobiaceae bacterium]|nr:hypothetical protein [Rhizobiaceae bacterium]
MSTFKKNTVRVIFALLAFVYIVSHFVHPVRAEGAPVTTEITDTLH